MARCVACDSMIKDYAKNQDLCYTCLKIVREAAYGYTDGHGDVHVFNEDEISDLYSDYKYKDSQYDDY